MQRLLPLCLLPILSLAVPAAARASHDEALWVNGTVSGRIAGPVVFFAEAQPRVGDGVSRLSQLLLRPALGVELSEAVTLFQGYAHVIDPVDNGPDLRENRLFQQLTWNVGRIGKLEVQSRTRLEERWRNDGDGMSLRARQMMRFEYPLAAGSRRAAIVGSAEGFVGLTTAEWGGEPGFDQLRTFVGVEIPLAGRSTIEAGYLNQTRDAPGGDVRMTHIASVSVFIRL